MRTERLLEGLFLLATATTIASGLAYLLPPALLAAFPALEPAEQEQGR